MINEQRINFLEKKIENEGIPKLVFPDYFLIKNLQVLLIDTLHSLGIPEDHIIVRETTDLFSAELSYYRRSSQFSGQHAIHLNVIEHFRFIHNSGHYSENKVKNLILFSMLHCYGEAVFEFFESNEFKKLYRDKPLLVNHNSRLMKMFFPKPHIMGTVFANYAMGKITQGNQYEALILCLNQYCSLKFSQEAIENSKLTREERTLRQDIDEICGIIEPNLTAKQAYDKNSSVVLDVASFLIRKDYKVQIIRGEGFKNQDNSYPQELLNEGMNPFLFSHEAVLCNDTSVIDFCAKAYGQESPIIAGSKYKWKKFWQEISISQELPRNRKELEKFDFKFSNEHKHD